MKTDKVTMMVILVKQVYAGIEKLKLKFVHIAGKEQRACVENRVQGSETEKMQSCTIV